MVSGLPRILSSSRYLNSSPGLALLPIISYRAVSVVVFPRLHEVSTCILLFIGVVDVYMPIRACSTSGNCEPLLRCSFHFSISNSRHKLTISGVNFTGNHWFAFWIWRWRSLYVQCSQRFRFEHSGWFIAWRVVDMASEYLYLHITFFVEKDVV